MSHPYLTADDLLDDDADVTLKCWREEITKALAKNGETWADLISITLSDPQLDRWFDGGFGGGDETTFTAWSSLFVYFPLGYDGAVWCGSAPRHPNGVALKRQGG